MCKAFDALWMQNAKRELNLHSVAIAVDAIRVCGTVESVYQLNILFQDLLSFQPSTSCLQISRIPQRIVLAKDFVDSFA